jgi:SNF2 family DNA or RNA helicase
MVRIVQYLADTGSDVRGGRAGAAAVVPSVEELARADVVITTYKTLMCETRKQKRIPRLLKVYWRRVVLDEMQEIRSSTTELAKICRGIQARFRWMVSGTPLFTGVGDLNGELAFLGVLPFCLHDNVDGFWGKRIEQPLQNTADPEGRLDARELLDALLGGVMIRHSKSQTTMDGEAILSGLPPATIDTVAVPLQIPTVPADELVETATPLELSDVQTRGASSGDEHAESQLQLQQGILVSHMYVCNAIHVCVPRYMSTYGACNVCFAAVDMS